MQDAYHEEQKELHKDWSNIYAFAREKIVYSDSFYNKTDRFFKDKLANLKWAFNCLNAKYGIVEEDNYPVCNKESCEWEV